MKKKIFVSSLFAAGVLTASVADAALLDRAVLNFDTGVQSSSADVVTVGSYFGMDGNGDGVIKRREKIAIAQNDGLIVGAAQAALGSHIGLPGCVDGTLNLDGSLACSNPSGTEQPGIDQAWGFFGSTGMSQSNSVISILSDDNAGNVTLDFSGWGVTWSGFEISLGAGAWDGNDEGVANMTCTVDCAEGDIYTLNYSATVPVGDPSGFGGVRYTYYLTGTVGAVAAVPVPAAVWLFGSGLIGLAAFARRRKTA